MKDEEILVGRIPTWQDRDPEQDIGHLDNKALEEIIKSNEQQRIKWAELLKAWESIPQFTDFEPFVWQAEPFTITPTIPVNREKAGIDELVYYGPIKDVPVIREQTANSKLLDLPYEFRLFAYQSIPKGKSWETDPQDFVYITDNGLNIEAPKRFFIRLQDLHDRLLGNYELRRNLFAADWFVAFAGIRSSAERAHVLEQLELDSLLLPDCSELYAKEDKVQRASAKIHKIIDDLVKNPSESAKLNPHFPLWDRDGKLLPWGESARLLASLFDPVKNTQNLAYGYIRNLCRLVRAGAVLEKEPRSVEARFWSKPIEGPNSVRFVYHFGGSRTNDLLPTALKLWAEIIEKQHSAVVAALSKLPKQQVFIPDSHATVSTLPPPKNCVRIGSHPQRFYDLYVSKQDWALMHKAGFQLGSRRSPRRAEIEDWKEKIPDQVPGIEITYTEITTTKLDRMTENAYPRCFSQAQLMENQSAMEVGKKISDIDGVRQAEWLHRSAWSFGGLDNDSDNIGPYTSQDRNNIVWGTYEANTQMIRYEEFLKRHARLSGDKVTLWTERVYKKWTYTSPDATATPVTTTYAWPFGKAEVDRNSAWIASGLLYRWAIAPSHEYQGSAKIYLFSRNNCTRFEIKMDEYVDRKLHSLANSGNQTALQILEHLWRPMSDAEEPEQRIDMFSSNTPLPVTPPPSGTCEKEFTFPGPQPQPSSDLLDSWSMMIYLGLVVASLSIYYYSYMYNRNSG